MRMPTREEQRKLVQQWEVTGRELEQLRREALYDLPYHWADVDALLALGDDYDGPPRPMTGMVEMQYYFMKGHPKRESEPAPAPDANVEPTSGLP
jgi:hypothetical protein